MLLGLFKEYPGGIFRFMRHFTCDVIPPCRSATAGAPTRHGRGYIVRDATGQAIAYLYGRDTESDARQAKAPRSSLAPIRSQPPGVGTRSNRPSRNSLVGRTQMCRVETSR
jgi:hypothetical protein